MALSIYFFLFLTHWLFAKMTTAFTITPNLYSYEIHV